MYLEGVTVHGCRAQANRLVRVADLLACHSPNVQLLIRECCDAAAACRTLVGLDA